MSTLVRNRTQSVVTMPAPFDLVLEPTTGMVFTDSLTTVQAALTALGISPSTIELDEVLGAATRTLAAPPAVTRLPYGSAARVFFVRPNGNDSNDGLTAASAFATLERALTAFPLAEINRPEVIDVTGMTIAADAVLNLGGTTLGGINTDLDLAATAPNNRFSRTHRQIVSDLDLVQAINVTGQALDPGSGLLTLAVSNTLVVNALRGRFAVGASLGQYGAIQGNTANTITVANLATMTTPVGVYMPGATLRFGDPANFFEQCLYLVALCDWTLAGLFLDFNGAKAAAISIWPVGDVYLTLCDIKGVDLNVGPGTVLIDGCYVHDATFVQDGATVRALQSVFRGLSFVCHGSSDSGLNEWTGVIIDACNAWGGGNVESRYSFSMSNCLVAGSSGHGVQALFGVSRIESSVIQSNALSGIQATNQVTLTLSNVQGAGNGAFGVDASYGAIVRNSAGTAITGASGDTSVGALGLRTWAQTPVTDPNHLVRVGA